MILVDPSLSAFPKSTTLQSSVKVSISKKNKNIQHLLALNMC